MKNSKDELQQLRLEYGALEKEFCNTEECKAFKKMLKEKKPLPEGVYASQDGEFYRLRKSDLTEEEIKEFLLYKQLDFLSSIKNSVLFFVVVLLIWIVLQFWLH